MRIIYSCNCNDTEAFVKDAYRILFPNQPLPPIQQVETLVEQTGANSRSRKELAAIQKAKGKFAFLYDSDSGEFWDLIKGVQIA